MIIWLGLKNREVLGVTVMVVNGILQVWKLMADD
jgi:hypothetical protein